MRRRQPWSKLSSCIQQGPLTQTCTKYENFPCRLNINKKSLRCPFRCINKWKMLPKLQLGGFEGGGGGAISANNINKLPTSVGERRGIFFLIFSFCKIVSCETLLNNATKKFCIINQQICGHSDVIHCNHNW